MEPAEELFVRKRSNLNMEGIKILARHAVTANKQLTTQTNSLALKQTNPKYPHTIILLKRKLETTN